MAKTKNNMQSSPKIGEFPHWSISPKALFTDITFLHDETDVKHIERYCLANGYIAFISYDEELSAWCWYELQQPLTETVWKKPVASKFEPPTSSPISELNLEKKIAKHLRKQGHNVKRQVRCDDFGSTKLGAPKIGGTR